MQTAMTPVQQAQQTNCCLIVEDSDFDCERLTRVLHKVNIAFEILIAPTLKQARRTLAGRQIELILLDNNLPDGLGANFAIELAQDPNLAEIPIIMVSDWPSPFMWEKAASAGVAYVLNKSEFDTRYIRAVLTAQQKRQMN